MSSSKDPQRGASQWFINEKSKDEQIKACRKSLEAAQRSGRTNIAEALQVKLDKLVGADGDAKSSCATGEPKRKKRITSTKVGATVLKDGARSEATSGAVAAVSEGSATTAKFASRLILKKRSSADGADSSKVVSQIRERPKKLKIISKATLTGAQSSTEESAIDILLRASAKAREARVAAGEESEDEALPPVPIFPPPREGLGEQGLGMVHEEGEEKEDDDQQDDASDDEDEESEQVAAATGETSKGSQVPQRKGRTIGTIRKRVR